MKKAFKYYAIVWTALLLAYNFVVFSIRPAMGFTFTYDNRFWVSWIFIIAAFIAQLCCTFAAFYTDKIDQFFLHIPLIRLSYIGTVLVTITGSVCLLIPDCPAWIAYVVCVAVIGFSAVAVMKAQAAADIVETVEQRVNSDTQFIRSLTAEAGSLVTKAQTDEAKAAAKKVYEALRYSDPMSSPALTNLEENIKTHFANFSANISESNAVALCQLIAERNSKCKLLK